MVSTVTANPYNFQSTMVGVCSSAESMVKAVKIKGNSEAIHKQYGYIEGNPIRIDTWNEISVFLLAAAVATDFSVELPNVHQFLVSYTDNQPLDDRERDLMAAAIWYKAKQEIQVIEPDAVKLKEITRQYDIAIEKYCESSNIPLAEVIDYFKVSIADNIATTVDREFNTISFVMTGKGYNTVLQRTADNGYKMTFTGFFGATEQSTKQLSAASLDELLAAMAKSSDFNKACVAVVQEKAVFIPGSVYDEWKKTFPEKPDAMARWTELITNFYLNPTKENYDLMQVIYAKNSVDTAEKQWKEPVRDCLQQTLSALSSTLGRKFSLDHVSFNTLAYAKKPVDSKYNPLFATYGVGGFEK